MAAVAVSAMLIGSLSDMEGVARGIRISLIAGMRHSVGTSSEEIRRTLFIAAIAIEDFFFLKISNLNDLTDASRPHSGSECPGSPRCF